MRFTTIFSAITVLAPAMAHAQTQANNDIWSGNIGMSTAVMPTYLGSNRYIVRAFPILSLEYKNRAYLGGSVAGTGAGAGVYLVRNSAFSWATEISGAPERLESKGDGLAGMGKRGAATYAATSVSYNLGAITTGAAVAIGLGSDEGSTGSINASTKKVFGSRWIAGLSTGATFANSENMAYDFGVSPEQATRRQGLIDAGDSRLSLSDAGAHDPKAGLKQMQVSTSLGYLLSDRTTAMFFASGTRLGQQAADSPLTRQRNGVVAGMGIAYGF